MLKEPLDFEYNKYTLLGYLQKCEKRFENLEIYPDFVELSLHLANLQSLSKENTLLLTNKKFDSCDDEILVKELYYKKPRILSKEEENELDKTIKFSGNKLFDAFNLAKSIWSLAFDNVDISLKRNKKNIGLGSGYVFHFKKNDQLLYVWEYQIKKLKRDDFNNKTIMNLIYEGGPEDLTLVNIIDTHSTFNNNLYYKELPIFELKSLQDFPIEQTLVPIMKRKLLSYILQIISFEKINNFDSEK